MSDELNKNAGSESGGIDSTHSPQDVQEPVTPHSGQEPDADRPSRRIQIGSARQGKPGAKARPHPASLLAAGLEAAGGRKRKNFPPPNIREQLPPELQAELEAAIGEASLDELMAQAQVQAAPIDLPPESRVKGRVVTVRNDLVFVELGGRNQGIVSARQFDEPPSPGDDLELVVSRYNVEEGNYECTRPGAAVDVADWDDVAEGSIVEVTITGSNKGGLECQVAGIRGFIPMGQVSLYHVENPEELVGERLACLVTEASRARRNLVLSRKAVMEREKAQAREKLLAELEPGQIREGIVRNLRDFGAFVDLGGVDGLIHISQLSWDHVKHPSEVLAEGQKVKVRVEKVDRETGKVALAYRDLAANPWDDVSRKFPVGSTAKGIVSKVMDFGAFVKLEPGVEGLVHISELAHGRVWRTADVISEEQEVEVKVITLDCEKQRMGLSLKALQLRPEPAKKSEESEEFTPPPDAPRPPKRKQERLKGGVGSSTGGEKFGLKW
jgi:small subunit ribosomal protein S1